jgi:hypothetical protein
MLLLATLAAAAQAPIERVPPPSPDWLHFTTTAGTSIGSPISVKTDRTTFHCVLDSTTNEALFCHPEFPRPFFIPVPADGLTLPRQHILSIKQRDRPASTLLGILVGFGCGAGLAVVNHQPDQSADVIIGGVLLGTVGGFIGHAFSLIHHTLYRAPQP